MEICFPDRCAVAQQQCKATLLLAKCNCPLLSAAVQNRLTAGLCHCKYTYGYLLSIQVCSGPTAVQGHTAFGKVQLPPAQCCCAKQADSRLVPLQIHLWIFSFNTGCAVAQQQCSATLLLAKCNCPLLSAAVQNRLTAGLCHCKYTYGYLLSDRCAVAQQQCKDTLLLAKCNCPLLSAAVQNRLTAGLYHCKYTYGYLLSDRCAVAQQQCKATLLLAKCNCPLLSAAVQNRLTAGLCHCKYTYGYLLSIQVCSGPTAVQGHTAFGKVQLPPAQCCCAKQADSRLVPLQIHLWIFAFRQVVQWPNSSARPRCFWQSAIAPCSVLLCKTG